MSKWECIVCGLVYDEKAGWPDDGIAPGTRWENVPEDWLCPDCGVGKEDFELVKEALVDDAPHHEQPVVDKVHAPVVILGTGLAGYGLAKEFRKHDSDTPLILITSDDGRSYSKPMLSTGYTKGHSADDLAQSDAGHMAGQLKASVWTMTKVNEIDTARQLIKVADADTVIHYGKLVLAVGAEVIRPPIEGDGLALVYSVNDLLDYADFRTAVAKNAVKKICIIGGGLIGCEYTNDLINGGFEVEVVDPLGYCLPTLLPEPAGKAVQAALEAKGATFHFGPLVTAVNKADKGVVVSLNNGQTISADIVLSAVGVRPRTVLAKASGITTRRGSCHQPPVGDQRPQRLCHGRLRRGQRPCAGVCCAIDGGGQSAGQNPGRRAHRGQLPGHAGNHQDSGLPGGGRPGRAGHGGRVDHRGRRQQCQGAVPRQQRQAAGLCPDRRCHQRQSGAAKRIAGHHGLRCSAGHIGFTGDRVRG